MQNANLHTQETEKGNILKCKIDGVAHAIVRGLPRATKRRQKHALQFLQAHESWRNEQDEARENPRKFSCANNRVLPQCNETSANKQALQFLQAHESWSKQYEAQENESVSCAQITECCRSATTSCEFYTIIMASPKEKNLYLSLTAVS